MSLAKTASFERSSSVHEEVMLFDGKTSLVFNPLRRENFICSEIQECTLDNARNFLTAARVQQKKN
jgi:hypothetical protein